MRNALQRCAARIVCVILFAALLYGPPPASAAPVPSSFGLLGGTISNTGTSLVAGNVGATTDITGFPPGTATGTVFSAGHATAGAAHGEFVTAFNAAILLVATQSYANLTANRLFIGNNVYTFTETDISTVTGINLTFDAENDPNAVFVIRTNGAFTANGVLTFTLLNQAQAKNIFWVIGTIATISVGSSGPMTFEGNILAGQSFTMSAAGGDGGSGVQPGTITGCVFAVTANTLAGRTNVNGCVGTGGIPTTTTSSIPEPGSSGLMGLGCLLGIVAWRRFRVSL
jgi:hypothetical protein